jgi:hypothetical protein
VPTLGVHLPVAIRVQQHEIRECVPAAIGTLLEMMAMLATLLDEQLAADDA